MSDKNQEEDGDWPDWEEEDGPQSLPVTCPACLCPMPSSAEAWSHMASAHGIDMAAFVKEKGWDELTRAKFVNYARSLAGTDRSLATVAFDPSAFESGPALDDALLKPALADDPMLFDDPFLFSDSEGEDEVDHDEGDGGKGDKGKGKKIPSAAVAPGRDAEVDTLAERIASRRAKVMEALERTKVPRSSRRRRSSGSSSSGGDSKRKGTAAAAADGKGSKKKGGKAEASSYSDSSSYYESSGSGPGPRRGRRRKRRDGSYFRSYARHEIHEDMIKDAVRTDAYRDAIEKNPDTFRGKVVLDIGCGTGILSMFCARAGARRVIGIDLSDIADTAKKVVRRNGLSDVVTIIKGRVEDVTLPDGIDKVDVIVSEWMGYALLYESMIATVLWARDKWLVDGGRVLPDHASIHCAAMCRNEDLVKAKIDFWDGVYGFDMRDVATLVSRQIDRERREPAVQVFNPDLVCSTRGDIRALDMLSMKDADQDFMSRCTVTVERDSLVDAMLIWFDIDFVRGCEAHGVSFSTAASCTPTHWMQVAVYLRDTVECKAGDVIKCEWSFERRAKNMRTYAIALWYSVEREGCVDPVAFGGSVYELV